MNTKVMKVSDIEVKVVRKKIKNLYLNILPPNGEVKISAPKNLQEEIIKSFIIKKLPWIKKHKKSFLEQARQSKREFISGESHYFKGQRYILKLIEAKRAKIEIVNKQYIYFYAPTHYTTKQKEVFFNKWLREELKKELFVLVKKWEEIMNVKVEEVRIKKMKTKWGSCNILKKRIWINLELIKKPPKTLEYVVVHEMVHFFEKYHNQRFKKLMSQFLPDWKSRKRELNEFIMTMV